MRAACRVLQKLNHVRWSGPLHRVCIGVESVRISVESEIANEVRAQKDGSTAPWQYTAGVRTDGEARLVFSLNARNLSTESEAALNGQDDRAGPLVQYERRVASGNLMPGDKNQEEALRALQRLYDELVDTAPATGLDRPFVANSENSYASQGSWFWSRIIPRAQALMRGLYLYGGVGTGKTMLMDMFYEELPENWRKKRIHFHDFMLDVHGLLQRHRGMADPLEVVADDLSKEAILLCVDEFMVTDVADALILNRLFGHLFRKGTVLVTTSNRAPEKLYEGGLQRDLFLPFIATLKERCVVHEIGSLTDYRKLNTAENGFYFSGDGGDELLRERFHILTDGAMAVPTTVEVVMGRKLKVPFGVNGCAYFEFHELCEMPLGAADYFGLFNHFHTLALEDIPIFGGHNRVAAYRFVTLIDVMYEKKARFLCSAEADPVELFHRCVTVSDAPTHPRSSHSDEADICVDNELGFAKERTISRLTEMNSRPYLEEHAATRLGTRTQSTGG
eukprot:c26589_g1_i2 orf=350-1867(+)